MVIKAVEKQKAKSKDKDTEAAGGVGTVISCQVVSPGITDLMAHELKAKQ